MPPPAPFPAPFPKPSLHALRNRIRRLERQHGRDDAPSPVLPTGAAAIDALLPRGGLAGDAVHEILAAPAPADRPADHHAGFEAAGAGFTAALLAGLAKKTAAPLLWCRRGRDLYIPGLSLFGLDWRRLVIARGGDDTEILWAMEEGLRAGVAAVVGEIRRLPATALRRLQLAAESHGVPALLLRPALATVTSGPVASRWRVATAASASSPPWPGLARWRVDLVRCRGGTTGSWLVDWRDEHTADERQQHEQANPGHADFPIPASFSLPSLLPSLPADAVGAAAHRLAVVATLGDGPHPSPEAADGGNDSRNDGHNDDHWRHAG